MSRIALSLGIAFAVLGVMDRGASTARAQWPVQTTVYDTVVPGPPAVSYGEAYKVRYKRHRTVIKERPVAFVQPTAPIIRETRVVRPAPIVQQQVIQSAPIVESRVIQPPPVIESRVIQPSPVIQTRYYGPYPY